MVPIAIILFAIIAKFVYVKQLEQKQLVSNKASEFCCRFTHVRQDILLSENTNQYATTIGSDNLENKQKLSKSIDVKGAVTLSAPIISFLVTLQLLEKVSF